MCDTLVARPSTTRTGEMLFAKNSDRERNEAQFVQLARAANHSSGEALQLTYVAIPQVDRTHACLLSRPFWMWGAEMGANEHGVVIGNEAVHSNIPASRRRALTGMDLVRLGLERATTAQSAVDVITSLLERHGQGGDCGHLNRFYYHNSFIIADATDAFVLETVGVWWVVEAVKDTRALSNALSIGDNYQSISTSLIRHAEEQNWMGENERFDFTARLIDRQRDLISQGRSRCARGGRLLDEQSGRLSAGNMMEFLRDHGENVDQATWSPSNSPGRTICMHAATGSRRSQTVGSMVSQVGEHSTLHWVTASSAPCLSIFKPVLIETGLSELGPSPSDHYDPQTRWWRHERLHRKALADYPAAVQLIAPERDALERSFIDRMDEVLGRDDDKERMRAAIEQCWREADAAEQRWYAALQPSPGKPRVWNGYARSWARLDQTARFPDDAH